MPGLHTPFPDDGSSRIVVALGGNAITRQGEEGTVAQDYANLRLSLEKVVALVERGHEVVLTHGNAPQVGNQMLRVELARGKAPDLPLDVMVADLQGGLGYMIERVLRNHLLRRGLEVPVCALLSQVEVDPHDPALDRATKFVGPAYTEDEARRLMEERDWRMAEDRGRGWRRVVPSPEPRTIVESGLIRKIVDWGALVIVTGGGGIPVARSPEGDLEGVEAVIDKDRVAAVLARDVGATDLFILTGVEQVYLRYGTPEQRGLRYLSSADARKWLAAGEFPPGSMGPKIEAACRFVDEAGGERALITDLFTLDEALAGRTGTWITR
ncbi:MAG: carbamate kinase [Thermoanaerobaculia bacterium]